MKEVIFKFEIESYNTTFYHDRSPIVNDQSSTLNKDFPHDKKTKLFLTKESSTSKEVFVENYGNKLCGLLKTYATVVIERQENKISLKVFYVFRQRRGGDSWFKVSKNVDFLTVNTKMGDFYHGFIHNYHKKKKYSKSFSKNSLFGDLVRHMNRRVRTALYMLDDEKIESVISEMNGVFKNELVGTDNKYSDSLWDTLVMYYFEKKKIKYPNNFQSYMTQFNKDFRKNLKKNNNKIVDTVMSINGLNGRKIKKALHECNDLNINLLKFAIEFFGEDWINQDDFILNILNTEDSYLFIDTDAKTYFTHEEKRKVYYLFKEMIINHKLSYYTFFDHIDLYVKLKNYGENDLRWMSKNDLDYFHKEHMEWTDKLQYYVRGNYKRLYPQYFYDTLSKDINGYYPVLLTTSKEYNDESNIQSNCVKSYIGRASTMIISLRNGGPTSDDRITIEYKVQKKSDEVSVVRLQTLAKFNQPISDGMNSILCILDKKVLSLVKSDKFKTFGIEKTCANGKFYHSDSEFNESGSMVWTYDKINVEQNSLDRIFNYI